MGGCQVLEVDGAGGDKEVVIGVYSHCDESSEVGLKRC